MQIESFYLIVNKLPPIRVIKRQKFGSFFLLFQQCFVYFPNDSASLFDPIDLNVGSFRCCSQKFGESQLNGKMR